MTMKKVALTLVGAYLLGTTALSGQTEQTENQDVKYRRSALAMILIESKIDANAEDVLKSWQNYPFPDKYDKHSIGLTSIKIGAIGEVKDSSKNVKGEKEKSKKEVKDEKNKKNDNNKNEPKKDAVQLKIEQVIKDKKIGNMLVAKWFNRSDYDDKFNMEVVKQRGGYNATELEAAVAKQQARGLAVLEDAGEELISNTFVTFTQLNFYSNELPALIVYEAAKLAANQISNPMAQIAALKAADIAYAKTREGYSLFSKTWLYKLAWNDSIAAVFYNELWNNPQAFDQTEFKLEFIGAQQNTSLVTAKLIGQSRTNAQYIDVAEVRNLDKIFAQLQKDHDVFKPKVPILTAEPLTAQVGTKEGLKGGEKFEVLEMTIDPETKKTKYERVGIVKVDKKHVWNNMYNVAIEGEKLEPQLDKKGEEVTATRFSKLKKAYPGMLLRQLK